MGLRPGVTQVFEVVVQHGPPAATDGRFMVRRSDVHYPHENSHLEIF
jgi:hypothetical protein